MPARSPTGRAAQRSRKRVSIACLCSAKNGCEIKPPTRQVSPTGAKYPHGIFDNGPRHVAGMCNLWPTALVGAGFGRYFIAALASLVATLTVCFGVLLALDTVFVAVPVPDETVRDAARVAGLTAPLTVFSVGDAGGGRLILCAFNNAFTASD